MPVLPADPPPRYQLPLSAGTGRSVVVDRCQVSGSTDLQSILFLGYLPPVNTMVEIGTRPREETFYPAELLFCPESRLVQLGSIVDPAILFPPHYAYTSGTTRILRENFARLYEEVMSRHPLGPTDLVVDVGANDGTLLSNFQAGHRVCGIEPTNACKLAEGRGIDMVNSFINRAAAGEVVRRHGRAAVVTATNVFAHVEDIHEVIGSILEMLDDGGIFISESHYLLSLLDTLQYDTVYHEHLRYYSLQSLKWLLERHGLEVIHACRIPTHGGSIRVYAARAGMHQPSSEVDAILREESEGISPGRFADFKNRVQMSKLELLALLKDLRRGGKRIYGIGAPSRASTLINYVGLDDGMIECVLEIKGSYKIGKFMPGTRIPVLEESKLFDDPPDYALMFSWHIADELMPKFRQKGYQGRFIIPLPSPVIA